MPSRRRQDLEDKIRLTWSNEWEELLDERSPRVYMPERLLIILYNARINKKGTLLEIYFKTIEPFEPDPVKFLRGLLYRVDKYIKREGLENTTRSSFITDLLDNWLTTRGLGPKEGTRKGLDLPRKKAKK